MFKKKKTGNSAIAQEIEHIQRFIRKTEDKVVADELDKNEIVTSLQLAGIMLSALHSEVCPDDKK